MIILKKKRPTLLNDSKYFKKLYPIYIIIIVFKINEFKNQACFGLCDKL